MRKLPALGAIALLLACSPPKKNDHAAPATKSETTQVPQPPSAPAVPVATEAPAGSYTLDKAHGSLIFRVNHIGFSHYTAQFTEFDAKLDIDPKDPAKASLTATVNPRSLALPTPPKGFLDELLGKQWLDTSAFAQITFKSTRVELTGPDTARITGDLSLHGVTLPVTLDARFNAGYAGNQYDPAARMGFSAHGSLNRSGFGIFYGIPAPGSTMGVSDNVDVIIETEFNGPPLKSR